MERHIAEWLTTLISKRMKEGHPFDWNNPRRCPPLLTRAIYVIFEADKTLQTIHPSKIRPRQHEEMFNKVRAYANGQFNPSDDDTEWKSWLVSCHRHDAQFRIAATFDRTISYWMLMVGFEDEKIELKNRLERERLKGQDGFHPWIGSRLMMLKLLLSYDVRARQVALGKKSPKLVKFQREADLAIPYIGELMDEMNKYSMTDTASELIAKAEGDCYERIEDKETPVSVAGLVSDLWEDRHKDDKSLSDARCLAVIQGCVNAFKHRAFKERERSERFFRYHVELAMTIQALFATVRFIKSMNAYLETAPSL